ncbi:MAG: tRNA epoxyqueuosine(34) reductase QueG [Filomicrobium sp.]|uniref:tRNA epoxyqueuosine(34) reductase QueG n=1 Tax=Candidatus Filomicrobium marinum TaxID=1608628 RepID=UPI0009E62951|nr:tRNA epoxyqueuosine(34) reductase QueG [Candidatus Filomicrobium marinum]MCV0367944.1 tRNA epoxyqueuosine(34) reductase QueG [Filomicrobium sp.]
MRVSNRDRHFERSSATASPALLPPRTTQTSISKQTDVAPAEAVALKEAVSKRARELGFDAFGVSRPDAIALAGARLETYVAAGHHGDMAWMETTLERRRDPKALMPNARSVIAVAMSYAPDTNPMEALSQTSRGLISVYAKGRDYHDVLKGRLKQLAGYLASRSGEDVKVFVDTAPLMEKPLAAAGGIGWQGKHTNLVSREHGSWLFLGAILTAAELPPDTAGRDNCGRCQRCLDVCPTAAFPAPYQLDARRCLAYLSIESKAHIPVEFRKPMGNRVYGCDDCLAVCPWNKFASAAREAKFAARVETDNPPIAELIAIDDRAFRERFAGTPVKRTGRDRIVRNALIAAGNSQDRTMIPLVEERLKDESELVRAMAVWALSQLADPDHFADLRKAYLPREADPDVRNEWEAQSA